MGNKLERRDFLRLLGAAVLSIVAAACRPRATSTPAATLPPESTATRTAPTSTPTPEAPTPAPTTTPKPKATTPAPTATPTPEATTPAPTATPTPEATKPASTEPPSPEPTATPRSSGLPQVAIAQADSYERALVRQQVQALLDRLGGVGDVVRPGDRVAIKVNLTGGSYFQPPAGYSAVESYVTHPEVVRALGELLLEAGAGQLFIVEAVFDPDSYSRWGYADVARDLGATLVDLNGPQPYGSFVQVPVGAGWSIYPELALNPLLMEVDTFVSVAKLKCHYSAGVTLAMKNLVGLLPVTEYRLNPDEWWRSAAHGTAEEMGTRLPRVIVDLNLARPIHLALIDGIKTGEGGEVPRGSFAPVAPGVLIAGKNAVATDAVATAVMSFDPTVNPPTSPFLHSDNHLNLAAALGLGPNRLSAIEVVGASIEDVRFPFHPSDREAMVPWHHGASRRAAGY